MFDDLSIGTDIEKTSRFKNKSLDNDKAFLLRIFTPKELEYSFSDKNSAKHLCARYCAKEATVKALSSFGITDVYYKDIEMTNAENGQPSLHISKYPNIRAKVSVSHSPTDATASVLLCRQ